MRTPIIIAAFVLSFARIHAADEPAAEPVQLPEPGFVSLFDGEDLNGWSGEPGVWRVEEHVIVGGVITGNPRNEFLTSRAGYRDFDLRLDYKLVGSEGFVNSGVQIRSVRTAKPPNEMRGYQADIGKGYSGSLYDESRRDKTLIKPPAELIERVEHPGEWNHYRILCQGTHVELFINGEKTIDYVETDPSIPLDGVIGLQIHGGGKSQVYFRNLRIAELPPAKLAP